MNEDSIKVCLPDGSTVETPRPNDRSARIDSWLQRHGVSLNTRCGGRGICRGCQIEVQGIPGLMRSCQRRFVDVPARVEVITVPVASWRDDSIHGISLFEVRTWPPLDSRPGIGLALDIGTTTVAACLWDLDSGLCLATASRGNGQAPMGDDVVSRISHALEQPAGLESLRRALVEKTLIPLIGELRATSGLADAPISEAVAAGNPVMLHAFLGLSLEGLARYPFKPELSGACTVESAATGLPGEFPVRLPPALGAFVGADVTAGALAANLLESEPPVLLIDMGTNGEILLKHSEGFLTTATAVGPAFEGGRLNCGATARERVIASLEFADGVWHHELVNGSKGEAIGISGAAYIDFLAQARTHGFLSASGRFDPTHPLVKDNTGEGFGRRVFVTDQLYVTEGDVAELIQAKAAIAGGIATLCEMRGIEPGELRELLIAGGFGFYLNVANAQAIGLLPDCLDNRIRVLGNSALGGASLALLSPGHASWEALTDHTRYVELNQIESFEDHFTDALFLDPME